MIVITGANGDFGRLIMKHLLAALPASELAASVREPANATPWSRRGVQVRHGDFNHPETLVGAFAKADTVLINATNYGTAPAVRARQQAAAIQAAESSGAGRIVITSWPDLDTCHLASASDYAETETLIAASPVPSTILRLTYGLAAVLARDVQAAIATGVLAVPAGAAHTTPAAVDDLAEATAHVLVEPGHLGRTYELTGPDAITWTDLAALASTLAGKQLQYRPISDTEFRTQIVASGFPAAVIDELLALYAAFRQGWTSTPSNELSRLLHRPATASLEAVRQAMSL
jgi:NAD(P)H dehydrogenase (quinone)